MTPDEVEVADLDALRRVFIDRRHELGLTQREVDDIAGIADGYTGKWEAGIKGLGKVSLGCLLGALKLRMVVAPAEQNS